MTIKDNITMHQKNNFFVSASIRAPCIKYFWEATETHKNIFVCVQNSEHRLCIGYLLAP